MIKIAHKLGIERNYLNLIKAIHEKCTTNVMLNGERLKAFPLRSEEGQRRLLSLLLSNTVLEVLARAIRQEKEMKGIHTGKEEVQ